MSKSDELFSKADAGEEIYTSFSARIKNNLLIFDKTINEWWGHFGLRIDTDNLNPENCKQYLIRVSNLYQEASYYYSLANASFGTSIEKSKVFKKF